MQNVNSNVNVLFSFQEILSSVVYSNLPVANKVKRRVKTALIAKKKHISSFPQASDNVDYMKF